MASLRKRAEWFCVFFLHHKWLVNQWSLPYWCIFIWRNDNWSCFGENLGPLAWAMGFQQDSVGFCYMRIIFNTVRSSFCNRDTLKKELLGNWKLDLNLEFIQRLFAGCSFFLSLHSEAKGCTAFHFLILLQQKRIWCFKPVDGMGFELLRLAWILEGYGGVNQTKPRL